MYFIKISTQCQSLFENFQQQSCKDMQISLIAITKSRNRRINQKAQTHQIVGNTFLRCTSHSAALQQSLEVLDVVYGVSKYLDLRQTLIRIIARASLQDLERLVYLSTDIGFQFFTCCGTKVRRIVMDKNTPGASADLIFVFIVIV